LGWCSNEVDKQRTNISVPVIVILVVAEGEGHEILFQRARDRHKMMRAIRPQGGKNKAARNSGISALNKLIRSLAQRPGLA
jgi:ribose/xylose/arabinose/galactoside ABC-type transport system permease subunit